MRKMVEFWAVMGMGVGQAGEVTEKLVKNLASEYQKVKQLLHISGSETSGTPQLRGSETIFLLFEQYYDLYFPHGGSTCPKIVLTEKSLTQYVA
jgi:hypothetical protein